jgi:hypothetical protein
MPATECNGGAADPGGAGAAARVAPLSAAIALAAAGWLLGCGPSASEPPPPPPGAVPPGQAIGSGTIAGRALFSGTPPPRKPIRMSGEASCHHPDNPALSEEVIVGPGGGLKNVFVQVVAGLGDRVFAPPAEPAVLDQVGCLFVPHVLAAQTNQVLLLKNGDPAAHNVRADPKNNPGFNVSMAGKGRTVRRYFSNPEIVKIRCDIHSWMTGYIAVTPHPFHAVTGDDGAFALRGLPSGTFEVEAWHETRGARRQTVTLGEGKSRTIEFAFE